MSKEVAVCINSLLTDDSTTTTDMTTIDTVSNTDAKNAISLSLYLLVWPHLDKLPEVRLSLHYAPLYICSLYLFVSCCFISLSLSPSTC